jgi:hypothetical protein
MARHDVYGSRFKELWASNQQETAENFEVHESKVEDVFCLDECINEDVSSRLQVMLNIGED